MDRFPSPSAYQEAVQTPDAAFLDEDLRGAAPEWTPLGLPRAVTGAFAAVFPMHAGAQRWAVKCFLAPVPDRQARYAAIARHLQHIDSAHTIPFEYLRAGIRVDGRTWPVVKMEWVEGMPLNRFVVAHRDRPVVLEELAGAWEELLSGLEAAGIAHGDLQHGNVLVRNGEEGIRLTLVDYDTMYVPALKGRESPEVGHRNYQHPDRTERAFGPRLDRFSALVIRTALHACRHRPELWERFDTGENLLFTAADFFDPASSALFDALGRDEQVSLWSEALRRACYLEPEAVPSLRAVRDGSSAAESNVRRRRVERSARRQRARAGAESRGPQRTLLEWGVVGLAGVALVGAVGLGALGSWAGAVGCLAGGLVPGLWLAGLAYRRHPAVRRRRRLMRELAYFDRVLADLKRQVATLRRERTALLERVEQLRAERLAEVRDQALEDRLRHHFTTDASAFDGITHPVVVRLKAAGLRNAYHVTPERLAGVAGLGAESRTRVLLWRNALAATYADTIPDDLSPAEERRFRRFVEHRRGEYDAEITRLEDKIEVQRAERAQVEARRHALPPLSFRGYLMQVAGFRSAV